MVLQVRERLAGSKEAGKDLIWRDSTPRMAKNNFRSKSETDSQF
jgi:hypothetical protein